MKNIFDLFISTFTLIILSPILLIITLLVLFIDGSPIFFKQLRPGFKNKPFLLYKFRTMKNIFNSSNNLLEDANRITNLGNFLRKTSLDELPSFWNVLKGDLSLVGPRPLLMEYLDLYTDEEIKRHEVKPGITGWAQINGRNTISWKEKFILDLWYVENQSFWLDIKILFKTFWKVFKKDGINQRNHATMQKFEGSN